MVQEALKTVLEHCSLESYASLLERQKKAAAIERKKRNAIQYPNGGVIWTKEDNVLLRNLHLSKESTIWQIACLLRRTPGAVVTRLKKYGYR